MNFFSEIRGVKFIWKKIRVSKFTPEKIRGLKILGFSEENTPGGYSPLKMTAPLGYSNDRAFGPGQFSLNRE